MVYDRHGKIQTNNLFDSQYLVRALHILFENYRTSCAVVLERQGAGFIPHLAWLSGFDPCLTTWWLVMGTPPIIGPVEACSQASE